MKIFGYLMWRVRTLIRYLQGFRYRSWSSEVPDSEGVAVHASKGDTHAVMFGDLRVHIVRDGHDCWYAFSPDINYSASGMSLESVQSNFEKGLSATIKAHLKRFGTIEKIMKTPEMNKDISMEDCQSYRFSLISCHEIKDEVELKKLPYARIAFIQKQAIA